MVVIENSVYSVGYNFMGQCTLREPVQRSIVQDLRLWWNSKTLAYFQESIWTPGLYLVLTFSNILIQHYFKLRLITLLHSFPCLVCHLATLFFAEITVASNTGK
jgi:hypothetical protein